MRLIHVVFRARYSGAEILVRDLSLIQQAHGFDVKIIGVEPTEDSFRPEINRLTAGGIQVFAPTRELGSRFPRTLFLHRQLRQLRPDFVIAHGSLCSFYARAIRALGMNYGLATVLHGDSDFEIPPLRRAEKLMYRFHDAVIGVSSASCDGYKRTVPAFRRVIHIPNGANLSRFAFNAADRQYMREQILRIEPGERVILQIGRIYKEKQQLLTCQAVKQLQSRTPSEAKLRLLFAGTTEPCEYARTFLSAVAEQHPRLKIEYLGGRPDIETLLCAADVCVLPSDREACSIAAIEAAASGIPLVLTDLPSFRVLHTSPGVVQFPVADLTAFEHAIAKQLALPEGTRFPRQLSDFSIERCAEKYNGALRA